MLHHESNERPQIERTYSGREIKAKRLRLKQDVPELWKGKEGRMKRTLLLFVTVMMCLASGGAQTKSNPVVKKTVKYNCKTSDDGRIILRISASPDPSTVGEIIKVSALSSNGLTMWTVPFHVTEVDEDDTVHYESRYGDLVSKTNGRLMKKQYLLIKWPESVDAPFTYQWTSADGTFYTDEGVCTAF